MVDGVKQNPENAFENLLIRTSHQGDVVVENGENFNVIEVGVELDFVDLIIQHNADSQAASNSDDPAFLGPAFISNFESLKPVESGLSAALTPTLLGTIAEGIALTSIDSNAAKLSIDFNCFEEETNDNQVIVEVPISGNTTPLRLTFNKQCGPPP